MDGEQEIVISKITHTSEPGKDIRLVAETKRGDYDIATGLRCPGNINEEKHCKGCKLKFKCFTSDALRIELSQFEGLRLRKEDPSIAELVEAYLGANGMKLTFTKADAIIEGNEATL